MTSSPWETIIGLEVHVQLATRSKMFCGCSTEFGDAPNQNVCPVCLGLPGALPTPNHQAVRLGVRAALALECTVYPTSVFARKNYFYPDLPKGYQISQFDRPLATDGSLEFESPERGSIRAKIVRLHLEEDAGKSLHDRFPGLTAVDLNRAGVPLAEIVGGPDLRSPAEARAYLVALKQLLQFAEISDCSMELGSLRVDANLSVRRAGQTKLGTKTELKNMNSFANVERALTAERDRQIGLLESGGVVEQLSMAFNPATGEIRPMRSKEESHDYRYFPDPDLPPLVLSPTLIEDERQGMPELPRARRERFTRDLGLSEYDSKVLCGERAIADYFEAVVAAGVKSKTAANWVMGEVLAQWTDRSLPAPVGAGTLKKLVDLVEKGTVSLQAAKKLLVELIADATMDPVSLAERLGLLQVSDSAALEGWADAVFAAHPSEVERYRNGELKLLGFFTGQVMKLSAGKADPKGIQPIIKQKLDS